MDTKKVALQKQILRQEIKLFKQQLTSNFIQKNSELISRKLLTAELLDLAQTVFVYVSQPKEVQTHYLIKKMLAEGKTIAVPKVIGPGKMSAVKISSFSQLKPGRFDILQPIQDEILDQPIELNIMPAVAADRSGHRLGMGKGFYDRFIQKHQPEQNLVLIFDEQLKPEVPVDEFDQSVEFVLTPQYTIEN
ncbi:MAG: 5-formyltetrahydrofolate cyclo-ligase [Patescibacteria group bacterium]|nr:5-formyltetrahydrofolate cyclo-ligase [Patescibacteria group bacterium]